MRLFNKRLTYSKKTNYKGKTKIKTQKKKS